MAEDSDAFAKHTDQEGRNFAERFRLLELIGEGANGTIYKAEHTLLNQTVAIKVLKHGAELSERERQRFLNEAKLALKLKHDSIVKTVASGFNESNEPYIVMELAEGRSLDKILREKGRLSLTETRTIGMQLAQALEHAHEHGIVHRDLKPGNVIIDESKNPWSVKLLDFGIAKLLVEGVGDVSLTQTGRIIGTPAYLSPEQCKGQKADFRSDIYSLACLLYECACGRPLFQGSSDYELMDKHLHQKAQFEQKDQVPEKLAHLLLQCLEKDPSLRVPTASAFAARLQELDTSPKKPALFSKQKPTVIIVMLMLITSVAFAGKTLMDARRQDPKSISIGVHRSSKLKQLGTADIPYDELAEQATNVKKPDRSRDNEKAAALLETACEKAKLAGDFVFVSRHCATLATYYAIDGKWKESEDAINKALLAQRKCQAHFVLPEIYANWARIQTMQGNPVKALELAETAVRELRNGEHMFFAYYKLASDSAAQIPIWRKVETYANLALNDTERGLNDIAATAEAEKIKDSQRTHERLKVMSDLCLFYAHSGQKNKLHECLQALKQLSNRVGNHANEDLLSLARELFSTGYLSESEDICLFIANKLAWQPELAIGNKTLLIRLAVRKNDIKKTETLKDEFKNQFTDKLGNAQLLLANAEACLHHGDKTHALEFARRAVLKAGNLQTDKQNTVQTYMLVAKDAASIALSCNNPRAASGWLESALAYMPKSPKLPRQIVLQAELQYRLAEAYILMNDKKAATRNASACIDLLQPVAADYQDLLNNCKKLQRESQGLNI